MRPLLLLVLALGACKDNEDTDGGGGATETDIPPTFLGYTERSSDAERRGTSVQVALVEVQDESSSDWVIGEQLAIQGLSGTGNFALELPDQPPSSHLRDLPGGGTGALYLPVIFDDANRDGVFEELSADLVIGVGEERWLVYLTAPQGGQPEGWAVYERGEGDPVYRPITAQAVVPLWGLSSQPRLSGVLSVEGTRLGVVALDERRFGEGEPSTFAAWSSAPPLETGRFDVTVTIRPSVAAFQQPPDAPRHVRMAHRIFEDVNDDGVYTESTDILRSESICFDGEAIGLRFVDTPRSIAEVRELAAFEYTSGWRFIVGDEEINTNALRWVPFGQGCAP